MKFRSYVYESDSTTEEDMVMRPEFRDRSVRRDAEQIYLVPEHQDNNV